MTLIANTQPAFALTPDNHQGHHGGHKRGVSEKDSVNFAATHGVGTTHHTTHDLSRQVGDLKSDALSAVLKSAYDTVVATNVQGEANKLATAVQGAELRVQAERNLALLSSNLEHASHEALMLATSNHASILLEMCKCCSKTDALIISESAATRDLIQSKAETALRDKLHSAEMAIIIANSKLAGGPIIPV